METQVGDGGLSVWANEAKYWKTDPLTDVKIPLQRPHPRDLRVKNPSGSVTPTRTLYARTPRYVFGFVFTRHIHTRTHIWLFAQ